MPKLFLPARVFTDIYNCHWVELCSSAKYFLIPWEHRSQISNLKLKAALVPRDSKASSNELSAFMTPKSLKAEAFEAFE